MAIRLMQMEKGNSEKKQMTCRSCSWFDGKRAFCKVRANTIRFNLKKEECRFFDEKMTSRKNNVREKQD